MIRWETSSIHTNSNQECQKDLKDKVYNGPHRLLNETGIVVFARDSAFYWTISNSTYQYWDGW